jgi:predicted HAD superfamily Cof-like phosphohydrolase
MSKVADQVREFHEMFGCDISETPDIGTKELRKLREDLLREEFSEYLFASFDQDLVEIADALGDMVYVIYGTALAHGIDLDAVLDEIHASNMSKADADGKPIYRHDGKILKGPDFFRPDIERILFGGL